MGRLGLHGTKTRWMLRATRNSPSPGPTRFPHTSQELETRSDELWPNRGFFIAGLMIVFMAIMNLQNTLASLARGFS